jgi:hypothetical protein
LTSDEFEELRAFLRDHVSSFEELEALLFFMRAPRRPWLSSDVAVAINLQDDLVQGALETLAAVDGILERTSEAGEEHAFRYSPPAELGPVLSKLQQAYDEQRLRIVQIMSSNAMERVRSSAARRLADAFRLERGKK